MEKLFYKKKIQRQKGGRTTALLQNIPTELTDQDIQHFLKTNNYKTDGLVMSKTNKSALVFYHNAS